MLFNFLILFSGFIISFLFLDFVLNIFIQNSIIKIDLDVSITNLETTNDIELDLQMIRSSIESFIGVLKNNDRLNELQTKITILVEILNKLHASKTKSSSYVGTIQKIVQEIFTICEVDIPIEPMDTSEDDEYARKLQEEFYNLQLDNGEEN